MPDGDERDSRTRAHLQRVHGSVDVPPTDTYLGLHLDEARALADQEGRLLVDRTPNLRRRRANLVTIRVNVLLDDDGVVVVEADVG